MYVGRELWLSPPYSFTKALVPHQQRFLQVIVSSKVSSLPASPRIRGAALILVCPSSFPHRPHPQLPHLPAHFFPFAFELFPTETPRFHDYISLTIDIEVVKLSADLQWCCLCAKAWQWCFQPEGSVGRKVSLKCTAAGRSS